MREQNCRNARQPANANRACVSGSVFDLISSHFVSTSLFNIAYCFLKL